MKTKNRFLAVFFSAIILGFTSFCVEASMRFSGKNIHDVFREANTGSLVGLNLGCGDDSADTQILFNNTEVCTGEAALTWNYSNDLFTIAPSALTSVTAERPSISSSARTLTLTDGTTITNQRINQFLAPTINGVAAGGTETVTNASTVYIDAAPSGSNITFTNPCVSMTCGPYALWVDGGPSRFDGNIHFDEDIVTARIQVEDQSTANTDGGHLRLFSGRAKGTADAGLIQLTGGDADTSGTGGEITIAAGSSAGNTRGGSITLNASDASGTNRAGGVVSINAGRPTGTGEGGTVEIDVTANQTGLSSEWVLFSVGNYSVGLADGTTLADNRSSRFFAPTINGVAGGGTETVTNASTLYINAAPSGSNITFTNGPYTIFSDSGVNRLDGDVGMGGVLTPGASLDVDPADVTSVTAEDIAFRSANQSLTLTDGTTILDQRQNQFIAPTINGVAAGGTETVTNSATAYIDAAPSGSNITLTNPYAFWIDDGDFREDRHEIDGGSSPTLSACGTTPSISGGDHAGKVTIGTGVTTSCTVTFAATYDNAPACVIAGDNTAVTYAATTTTSALTITSSADMASDAISFICVGYGS